MDQADVNSDPVTRMQQYNKIEQQLVNEVAWMSINQQKTLGVRKPCVMGLLVIPTVDPPDDWANIYISTATPCADGSTYSKAHHGFCKGHLHGCPLKESLTARVVGLFW